MVQEDLKVHENQLSLISVYELLSDTTNFNSCQDKILQFKLFVYAKKPKPPITYEIAKLPRSKPLMRPEEIVRIFPMELIKRCEAKVTAYQRKHKGVRELDVALEVVGVGVFANTTIKLMKKWHKINRAPTWIEQGDLSFHGNTCFSVKADPELPAKLKEIPILTPQIFGSKKDVFIYDASTMRAVEA
ncbi:hypothetical protein GQ600_5082 [Phytophthora cactorum]|nr:hypothetical protein GQ600_5082 [Phytophthora cactorum]